MNDTRWVIAGEAVYSAGYCKTGSNGEWLAVGSVPEFYRNALSSAPVKLKKCEKFFRIGEQSAITITMALLALKQTEVKEASGFGRTAVLGYGNDGSHHNNLTYWHDYVDNGRVSAQGHLFVGTLASTPLCQLALTLGCHAPVYYVSPRRDDSLLASELDFIREQCENLFFIGLKHDFCSCAFLQPALKGISSEEVIAHLGGMK